MSYVYVRYTQHLVSHTWCEASARLRFSQHHLVAMFSRSAAATLLCAVLALGSAHLSAAEGDLARGWGDSIHWRGLDDAFEEAKLMHKPIMMVRASASVSCPSHTATRHYTFSSLTHPVVGWRSGVVGCAWRRAGDPQILVWCVASVEPAVFVHLSACSPQLIDARAC